MLWTDPRTRRQYEITEEMRVGWCLEMIELRREHKAEEPERRKKKNEAKRMGLKEHDSGVHVGADRLIRSDREGYQSEDDRAWSDADDALTQSRFAHLFKD